MTEQRADAYVPRCIKNTKDELALRRRSLYQDIDTRARFPRREVSVPERALGRQGRLSYRHKFENSLDRRAWR